uniref:(California timema) hypothetical protein n=1 Tax=Timema californicum TaxID=61474 RepID=A0A7R9JHT9_TIMCA|nr:unnamed protein product [Timema californicum]
MNVLGMGGGGFIPNNPRQAGMEGLVLVISGARVPGTALVDFSPCPAKRFRSQWVSVDALFGTAEQRYSVTGNPFGGVSSEA